MSEIYEEFCARSDRARVIHYGPTDGPSAWQPYAADDEQEMTDDD
jgi:hypothetical protein